jgi:hypothetical protein
MSMSERWFPGSQRGNIKLDSLEMGHSWSGSWVEPLGPISNPALMKDTGGHKLKIAYK